MLRGHRSTYLSLFLDDTPKVENTNPKKLGRDEQLLADRNLLLLHRHYFHFKIKEKQYHRGLEALVDEFFLAERTIVNIVQDNTNVLKELRQLKPDVKYFKRKYPFMNWE